MGYFSELQIGGKLDYIASRTNFKPAAAASKITMACMHDSLTSTLLAAASRGNTIFISFDGDVLANDPPMGRALRAIVTASSASILWRRFSSVQSTIRGGKIYFHRHPSRRLSSMGTQSVSRKQELFYSISSFIELKIARLQSNYTGSCQATPR